MLAVITVTSTADNTFPGGGVTLREAIQAANTDSSVDGSVAGSGADTIEFALALSGQTITLGGADLQITAALTIDATALAANVTIDGDELSRIFNITATTGDYTLAGLTLTGGKTIGDNVGIFSTTFDGGAVRSLTTGNLTLDQSTVSGNSTTGDRATGGGIRSSGDVTLTNSTVSGNSTTGDDALGGGIRSLGSVTLTSSTVSGNSTTGSDADGGGIRSFGDVTLNSSTVSGNSTQGISAEGGGINASFGSVILTSSTVSGNRTEGSSSVGGGIRSLGAVTLNSSTVSGNRTTGDDAEGGGIYSRDTVTLNSSTVSGNSTAGSGAHGGGIRSSGSVTLISSTVSGNSTAGSGADGGGIRSFGSVTLTSSTVTANHATEFNATGGGIWNNNDTITITNSIVAGNTAGGGSPDINPGTGILDVSFSLVGTAVTPDAGGSGNIFSNNPLLGPLAFNGGLTETHALLDGSPAIDTGDPGFDVGTTPNDQRGAPFLRGVGLRVDIGAFERQLLPGLNLTVDTNTDESDGDFSAGDFSLREAVALANGSVGTNTITFDASLSGQTITLGGTEIEISEALTIDARALAANVTIDANNASRIFSITATAGDFTLGGLTLAGGRTTGDNVDIADTTFDGGAVRSFTTGNLTLDQSIVSGNSTAGSFADGGGIFTSGAVTLTSSTVSGNSTGDGGFRYAGGAGGGIFASGAVTLTSSTVSGNRTGDGGFGNDGGNDGGDGGDGGGIFTSGAVTLTNSTVSGNSTGDGGNGGYGGAGGNGGAGGDGGGIFASGFLTLTNSTISGNRVGDGGNGGYGSTGDGFNGNGGDGGGIHSFVAVTLTSSTVTDNHVTPSSSTGGGIWNNNDTITITNSIVAGNTAGEGSPDIRPGTGVFDVNFSLLGTAVTPDAGGSGILFEDNPLLGALANNGGPTETHALLVGSLALGSGDPGFSTPPDFDQRGAPFARVFGGRIDIGAVEDQPLPASADFDTDGDVDGADFLAWQRGFGTTSPTPAEGDADFDADVDATDLVVWSNQFGQPTPVAVASAPLATEPVAAANLIDAVMAVEWYRSVDAEESAMVDEESAYATVAADRAFAAEAIALAVVFADDSERLDTNPSEDEEAETLWLAADLLERVFG